MIKVGVIGAAGRMGSETCRTVEAADDLELAARIGRTDPLDLLVEKGCDVAIDFTTPSNVEDNVRTCLERGIHTVVGTSGLDQDALGRLEAAAGEAGVGVLVVPNFALGAVLMMRFAQQAARFYDWAEIIERHHEKKLDAPSGTAARTASMMSEAKEGGFTHSAGTASVEGALGAKVDGVTIHSLRLPGSVAHQEVILGAPGETLSIKHDSLDRTSFMPGVLLAIRSISDRPGLTVGLEALLDL